MTDDSTILNTIRKFLVEQGAPHVLKVHEPTYTSVESAAARGDELKIGGKALLLKCDDKFVLCVLPADRRLDSKAAKRAINARKVRFATAEELHDLTSLVPGSVPPFGKPILPFDLYVDEALVENGKIAFNAGSLTTSIIMGMADYLKIAKPVVRRFSTDE